MFRFCLLTVSIVWMKRSHIKQQQNPLKCVLMLSRNILKQTFSILKMWIVLRTKLAKQVKLDAIEAMKICMVQRTYFFTTNCYLITARYFCFPQSTIMILYSKLALLSLLFKMNLLEHVCHVSSFLTWVTVDPLASAASMIVGVPQVKPCLWLVGIILWCFQHEDHWERGCAVWFVISLYVIVVF